MQYTRCRNIEARFSVSAMFKYMLAVFLAGLRVLVLSSHLCLQLEFRFSRC